MHSLLLVLLLASSQPQVSRKPADTTQGQSGTNKDEGNSGPTLPIVLVAPQKTTDELTRESDREAQEKSDRNRTSAFTFAQTAAALIGLLVAGFQVHLLIKQNRTIDAQTKLIAAQAKTMDDGLAETRRATNAAVMAANVADKSLNLTERARLAVDHFGPYAIVTGKQVVVSVHLINRGRTTATPYEWRSGIGVHERLPDEPVYNSPVGDLDAIHSGDQCQIEITRPAPLTVGESDRIAKGEAHLFIWGKLDYIDVLGKGQTFAFVARFDTSSKGFDRPRGSGKYAYET